MSTLHASARPALLVFALCCSGCGDLASLAKGNPEWRQPGALPAQLHLRGDKVSFVSRDGLSVSAWWLPAPGQAQGSVILAHGRGGNRSSLLPQAAFLLKHGLNVLSLDLRSCGESEGDFPSPGYLEAAEVLGGVSWVRAHGQTGPVVLFGHSMGAVAVLHAASQSEDIAAVIADSAFASPFDMLDRFRERLARSKKSSIGQRLGLWMASQRTFAPLFARAIRKQAGYEVDLRKSELLPVLPRVQKAPVLFISGELDDLAPPSDAVRMFQAVPGNHKTLLLLPGAGHQTFSDLPGAYERGVLQFLASALPSGEHLAAVSGE